MNCMFIHTATCSKWTACCGSGTASTKPWFILPLTKMAESFLIECCSMFYVALCSFFFSCTFLTHFIPSFLLIHQGILAFCSAFICLFVCFYKNMRYFPHTKCVWYTEEIKFLRFSITSQLWDSETYTWK